MGADILTRLGQRKDCDSKLLVSMTGFQSGKIPQMEAAQTAVSGRACCSVSLRVKCFIQTDQEQAKLLDG